ncbi:MAG TPA: ribonuclease H-like domain-containing protein [Candidatus Limnocylindrales bacterium]|nr:ribonuclease H-like domain-containing protein [Candidatus Limnocylindrales bacterium]
MTRDLAALRERIAAISARPPAPRRSPPEVGHCDGRRLPPGCVWEETPYGPIAVRRDRERGPEREGEEGALEGIARFLAIAAPDLARPCFLDTETTGLSGGTGTVAFLVGLAWPGEDGLELAQYFLSELDQEPALLWAVGERLRVSGVLVTYNGRSFDWPLLQTRLAMTRARSWPILPHVDLLGLVRRLFKPRLPDCTLRTVEAAVLALEREEDIPGALIPARYFGWLSGTGAALEAVFRHNRQDVVSLAVLIARLDRILGGAERLDWTDRFARARYLEACGFVDDALAEYRGLWQTGRPPQAGAVGVRLARLLRRAGHWREARAVLEACWASHSYPYPAAIELAKLLEHDARDLAGARRLVASALELIQVAAVVDARWRADLERRRARLDRRLSKVGPIWERLAVSPSA